MRSYAAGRKLDVAAAAAWAAALLALAGWLGSLDLLDPDEARHAEIAREMLGARSWIVPLLHGEPYFQKPAAFYWLLGGALHAFGENAAAARLPSVAAGLWTIYVTARFARMAYSRAASAAVVAGLATTVAFLVVARTVVVDMVFTAAVTTALAWLGMWRLDAASERRSIWPFYFAVACAVLVKGPAAIVLAGMVAIGAAASARDWGLLRAMKPVRGVLLVTALVAPWFVAAWHASPEYLHELLLRQNLERYLRPIGAGHVEPWYYYVVALPVGLLPWTPVVAYALHVRLRTERRTDADVYCAVWAGAVLAFFAPAATKLLTYLLPAFPPLICLAAVAVTARREDDSGLSRWLPPYAAAWTFFGAAAAVGAATYVAVKLPGAASRSFLAVLPLGVLAFALAARRSEQVYVHLATVAAATVALSAVAYGTFSCVLNDFRDSRTGAAVLVASAARGAKLVAYRCTPHAVAFYARKPAMRTRDAQLARDALAARPPAAVLTERKRLGELGFDPLPHGVRIGWYNDAGLVMLVAGNAPFNMAEKGGSRTLRRP